MAERSNDFIINDHFFHQALSCPLKISHMVKNSGMPSNRPVFRQRNKLNVRDAVARRSSNCRHTSDDTEQALEETKTWLSEQEAVVCGAVLKSGNLVTRIPILIKKGGHFTIIQIHGKLRKQSQRSAIETAGKKRGTALYLLKAAYRAEVAGRCYPGMTFDVEFYFPNKDFRSTVNGLNRIRDIDEYIDEAEFDRDLKNHFSCVDATKGVSEVFTSIPEMVAHARFAGRSVTEVAGQIETADSSTNHVGVDVHRTCKYCEFRKPADGKPGCWETFFPAKNISKPDKHIFELMGHGNILQSGKGVYYQEQAEIHDGLRSFDLMRKYGGPKITIQQRRNLQILSAKNNVVPGLWLKPGLKKLTELPFPLHFIDFEAATYALPMKRGVHPYDPVYFQFSCHTLHETGELVHTEWLDEEPARPDPHPAFTEEIARIPGIFEGTLIQFSPFEKQAINKLILEFRQNSMLNYRQIEQLENIRSGSGQNKTARFFDLNEMLRNYYHNCFLDEGLGLKQVLKSVVDWEKTFGNIQKEELEMLTDPYLDIQWNGSGITNGSVAMNAWIAMKNGLLTSSEKKEIPGVLKKYCALDSYSMVVIYQHLMRILSEMGESDVVLFHG
jgi:hypothetical protein